MQHASFIGIYDSAMPSQLCDDMIQRFEASDRIQPGQTGHGIDRAKKDSVDLTLSLYPEWADVENQIQTLTHLYLKVYIRHYPYLMLGGVSPSIWDPTAQQLTSLTPDILDRLSDDQWDPVVRKIFRMTRLNIQKYRVNQGGYHHWHSEIYPDPNDLMDEPLHRVLFFQYYLNTVDAGGETEFYDQKLKVKPEQGRLLIAPAGFTHTHKGHIPNSCDKYIVTSWILFQRATFLYS